MVKQLSNEEIRQINFIRTFDDNFIDSWSLDRDILSLTVIDNGIRYRVILSVSSFVGMWFVRVWSVRLAKHCPAAQPVNNIYTGYNVCADYNSLKSIDVQDDSFCNKHLINEMYDTDIR